LFPSSYFPPSVFPTAYFAGGSGTGGGGGGEVGGGAGGTIVRIISPTLASCCQQTVYLRARWYDQWEEVTDLWCESAEWTVSPTIPTAELRLRYGHMLLPGSPAFVAKFRMDRPRYYVKIVFESHPDDADAWSREWYGVIELEVEDVQGPRLVNENGQTFYRATGINRFIAYGLESLLDNSHILTSRISGGARVDRAIPFNHNIGQGLKEGNKSPGGGPGGVPVFHNEKTGGAEWNTLDICKYLLKYHTPRKTPDAVDIPFELSPDADNILPNFDRPEIPAEGKTTREVLNSLIARQRLLGWYAAVDGQDVVITPFSYTGVDISLASSPFAYYRANPNQKIIATEKDRTCSLIVKRSTADQFDRIVVRGARRTSTGSFSFTEGTLAIGWPGALETAYEAGASGAGDYPAAGDIEERYYRNMQARKAPKFKSVYSRFIIPEDFGGYVGDGEGLANQVLMPSDADEDTPASLAPEDLRFRKTMPLLDGYDYSGIIVFGGTRESEGPHEELPPLVLFRRYDWAGGNRVYRPAEGIAITAELADAGINEDELWSARVDVAGDGALMIDVDGEQHWIAETDFTRLADLDPEPFADFRDMIVTASVEWSQFAEGAYPEEIPFQIDAPRELLILAGDTFRCDYVVPDTVVGIDAEDGTLERTNGGYLQDDRTQLATIARQAYEWYSLIRKAITLETKIITGELQLGDFIVSLGDPALGAAVVTEDVNSVLTAIKITMQLLESPAESGGVPPPPSIRYETGYGELDPLAFVRGE
jgi:hypothetical protein